MVLIAGVASESALFEVSRSEGSIDVSSDIAGVASVAALARVLRSEGSVDMMLVLVLDLPLDALGKLVTKNNKNQQNQQKRRLF